MYTGSNAGWVSGFKALHMAGSPGLVIMGGGSCSEGHGFESRRRVLDGHNIFYIYLL